MLVCKLVIIKQTFNGVCKNLNDILHDCVGITIRQQRECSSKEPIGSLGVLVEVRFEKITICVMSLSRPSDFNL